MALGTAVHAEVEHRLLSGAWREEDGKNKRALQIAKSNEHQLPDAPVEKKWVEASLRIDKGTNDIALPVIGYIDWVEPFANRINDHKTQSDSRWSSSEMELSLDPQAIIYTKFALLRYPTVFKENHVKFRHIYYPTSSRSRPDVTEVRLSIRDIDSGFQSIVDRTILMVEDAQVDEAKDIVPNLAACGDYGGCPFRGHCSFIGDLQSLDPFSLFDSSKEDKGEKIVSSFFDKVKKAQNTPAGINPPSSKKETAEKPTLTTEELVEELKKLNKEEVEAFKLIPTKIRQWIMRQTKAGSVFKTAMNRSIIKMGKDPNNKAAVAAIHSLKAKGAEKSREKEDKELLTLAQDGWKGLAKDQTGPKVAPEKKFTRSVSQNPVENVTLGDYIKNTETHEVVEDAPNVNTRLRKLPEPERGHSILYVDCMPRFQAIEFFDEWIQPIVNKVLTAHRARHYMLHPLDYGKGKAEIQCELSVWLRAEGNRLPERLNLSRRHPLADIFIAETAGMWHEVVEG
jgi:hypothetical protein